MVGLLLAAAIVVPTVWGGPWSIEHLYSRVFLEFLLRQPMLLSQLAIEPYGLHIHNDDLDWFLAIQVDREPYLLPPSCSNAS